MIWLGRFYGIPSMVIMGFLGSGYGYNEISMIRVWLQWDIWVWLKLGFWVWLQSGLWDLIMVKMEFLGSDWLQGVIWDLGMVTLKFSKYGYG